LYSQFDSCSSAIDGTFDLTEDLEIFLGIRNSVTGRGSSLENAPPRIPDVMNRFQARLHIYISAPQVHFVLDMNLANSFPA
jgi:hypothetical protein